MDLIKERRPAFEILSPRQEFNLALILSAVRWKYRRFGHPLKIETPR